jgi:hypothetical protein
MAKADPGNPLKTILDSAFDLLIAKNITRSSACSLHPCL